MTAKKNDIINVSFEFSFFKELLKALSLEQMQEMSAFLNEEISDRIIEEAKQDTANEYPKPAFSRDMIVSWEEEEVEEEEVEQSEEEFNRAVQEMS
ncbi:MAG: hypothetical protein AAGG68_02030 [Bacteroidota bacterium]